MWDRATRGHAQRIDQFVAKNTGRGKNVAVWSRIYGLQTGFVESAEVLRHDDIPASGSEKKNLAERTEITIRVIYFDKVREGFQRQYQAAIKAGYAAVGMAARDFSAMDRKQALSAVVRSNLRLEIPVDVVALRRPIQ